jgi:hypothetical protein
MGYSGSHIAWIRLREFGNQVQSCTIDFNIAFEYQFRGNLRLADYLSNLLLHLEDIVRSHISPTIAPKLVRIVKGIYMNVVILLVLKWMQRMNKNGNPNPLPTIALTRQQTPLLYFYWNPAAATC